MDSFFKEGSIDDTQKGKYLTFPLGKEMYAIEIRLVTEIICIQPITELPEVPDYIKGIVNIRGKVIPVMDVRLRFRLQPIAYSQRTCIVIIEANDISVGLIVDDVSEVLSIADNKIKPLPNINKKYENKFVKSIGVSESSVILILDYDRLLNHAEEEISRAV